jgi:hypothetical protein
MTVATCVIAVFAVIGTIWNGFLTRESNELTQKSNQRAEKIFGAQIRPWVQAKPVEFEMRKDSMGRIFGTTKVRIVNFTNFDALKVRTDVMYGGREWIREWQQAKIKDYEKKLNEEKPSPEEAAEYEYYKQNLRKSIGDLIVEDKGTEVWRVPIESGSGPDLGVPGAQVATGTHIEVHNPVDVGVIDAGNVPVAKGYVTMFTNAETGKKRIDYLTQEWKGTCPSEDDICTKDKQFIVAVRAIWQNERWREFETIDYYIHRCTRTGGGTSFTFIPKYLSPGNTMAAE